MRDHRGKVAVLFRADRRRGRSRPFDVGPDPVVANFEPLDPSGRFRCLAAAWFHHRQRLVIVIDHHVGLAVIGAALGDDRLHRRTVADDVGAAAVTGRK